MRRLAPWIGNLRWRLVRSRRAYLRDSGLLHALLRIESRQALLRHPSAGASWEGFVIERLLGTLAASGAGVAAHVLRTSDGHELDLVLESRGKRAAIEVKLSASASPHDLARLERAADWIGAEHRDIVCQTQAPAADTTRGVIDVAGAIERRKRLARARSAASRLQHCLRWALGRSRGRCIHSLSRRRRRHFGSGS